MKHSSIIQFSPEALKEVSGAIAALTEAEGLPSHDDSVRLKIQDL